MPLALLPGSRLKMSLVLLRLLLSVKVVYTFGPADSGQLSWMLNGLVKMLEPVLVLLIELVLDAGNGISKLVLLTVHVAVVAVIVNEFRERSI